MQAEPLEIVTAKIESLKARGLEGYPQIDMDISSAEEDESKKSTMYTIKLTTDDNDWGCKKTYRDFKTLRDDLRKKHHIHGLPQLPGKQMFTSKTQISIQRRALLQDLLTYIKSSHTVKLDVVQEFFDFPSTLRISLKEIWEVLDSPIIEQELEKKGHNVKNWKTRHVQCCMDYTMRYYDPSKWLHGQDEKLAVQKGVVDLRDIISLRQQMDDEHKKFILELTTKERVWNFAYKNQKELDMWFSTVQMLREDKVGVKGWLPAIAERSRSLQQAIVLEDSEDEEIKEDLEAIKQEQTARGVTEREIQNIQDKIKDQATIQKRRIENMEKTKKELENQHRLLRSTKEKIEKIQKTKTRLRAEATGREQELKTLTRRLMEQHQEMQSENNAFQSLLETHKLIPKDLANDGNDIVYNGFRDLDPSPIVEGRLWKFGKGGRKKAKKKYVVFVALEHGCYVEWTESVKPNQATTRMKLLGWSLDNKLMDSRKLKDDELDRLFILRGTNRLAIFMAASIAERDRWIDGFQRAKLLQLQGKK